MGLLKFNSQSFAVEGLPDGLVAVTEGELTAMKHQVNQYLSLKSRIPVGVDETQVATLIEKGSRYDGLSSESTVRATKIQELEGKVKQFSNIPDGFTVEQWNKDRSREKQEIFNQKLSKIEAQALAKAKEVAGVDVKVDPRFVDSKALEGFDPDSSDAVDKYYKILDNAHTAQQEFLQQAIINATPVGGPIGDPGKTKLSDLSPSLPGPSGDIVGPSGPRVAGLTR